MLILLLQFAYLQLGTIIATIVRRIELKLEQPVPEHNYRVSFNTHHDVRFFQSKSVDDDHHAQKTSPDHIQAPEIGLDDTHTVINL